MRVVLSLLLVVISFVYLQSAHISISETTANFIHPATAYAVSGQVSISGGNTPYGDPNIMITLTSLSSGNESTAFTNSTGNYTISGSGQSTISIIYSSTKWYPTTPTSLTINASSNPTVNFSLSPILALTGTVTNAANGQGVPNVTVTTNTPYIVTSASATTDASGNYSINFYPVCYYNGKDNCTVDDLAANLCPTQVTMTVPSGWTATTATTQAISDGGVCLSGVAGPNFGLSQALPTATPTPTPTPTPATFSISGSVFVDSNKDSIEDNGETNYSATPSITSPNGGTVTPNSNGSYTITNLTPGAYTVTYGGQPAGYYMTSPLTGPPISFKVTVGSGCSVNGAPGATCTNGNIANLSFGISNTYPWFQSTCGDIRNDNGITDTLPAGQYGLITAASCNNPGIGFSGNSNASFGSGQVSTSNQIVGGATYPELYSAPDAPLETGYTALLAKAQQAGVTPTDLSTKCTLSNCTLAAGLGHGIYLANGNITLNAYIFPANQDYVILVNGNLTINGAISVPVGSTALFSANGNITVNPTVGTGATVGTSSLDGWYVAGGSFILPTQGGCNDLRLNIAGSVIVNALGTGGTFQNNRDLCGGDTTDPTVSFLQRLDMILNAPQFIENQQTLSQEVAP